MKIKLFFSLFVIFSVLSEMVCHVDLFMKKTKRKLHLFLSLIVLQLQSDSEPCARVMLYWCDAWSSSFNATRCCMCIFFNSAKRIVLNREIIVCQFEALYFPDVTFFLSFEPNVVWHLLFIIQSVTSLLEPALVSLSAVRRDAPSRWFRPLGVAVRQVIQFTF